MTGRQQWRGGKPQSTPVRTPGYRPADLEQAEAVVEDLPGERVRPVSGGASGGGFRIGATSILAVTVLVGMLAAGFGLLGDGPDPSPSATASGPPTAAPTVPQPQVTPSIACAPEPFEAPKVLLEMNGRPTPGRVEVLPEGPLGAPSSGSAEPASVPVVDIEVDKHTEIWIEGGTCAVAWDVLLGQEVLDRVVNPARDPGYAAQNRFSLQLAPYRPRYEELRAVLYLGEQTLIATWRVNILDFSRPTALLVPEDGDARLTLVEGCDVSLVLGNGWIEGGDGQCSGEALEPPLGPIEVDPGGALEFQFDGWTSFTTVVSCGSVLDDLTFVDTGDAGCPLSPDGEPQTIVAPDPGEWTLAINACATQDGSNATNRVCGTWYGKIKVRF